MENDVGLKIPKVTCLPDGADVVLGDAHDAHGLVGGGELLGLVHTGNLDIAVAEEGVVLGVLEDELF